MNILFVCSGNITRSFLAEALFQHEIKGCPELNAFARSAGLRAFPGNDPDPEMVRFLLGRGLAVPDHQARPVSREDVAWADRILVMEKEHLRSMERGFPESAGKTELLGRYIAETALPDEIGDPFGLSSYHYRLAQSQIGLAIQGLRRHLEAATGKGPAC